MTRIFLSIAGATLTLAAIVTAPAEARGPRGHTVSVQGANGRGLTQSRSVDRQPGSTVATRSLQTNSGRGYNSTRTAAWGDGSYSGGRTTTTNNGSTFGRSTTATSNGDGTGSFDTTFTGAKGQSTTVGGTVSVQH